jgi:ribosome-associated translation inhibitor RaiA
MEAILKFNLSDSDDAMEFKRVNKSLDLSLALWEIMYNTRKKIIVDLENEDNKNDKFEAVDIVFDKLWEILNKHNIDLEEIVQ